jgi:CRP-like cAMP-binding protein
MSLTQQRYRVSTSDTIEHALAQLPIFEGINEKCLRLLARAALPTQFAGGQWIFKQGDPATHFYVITKGKVGLICEEEGEPCRFAVIGKNEVAGWSWLFPPHAWHFTARAIIPTEAIFFCGSQLLESCENDKEFGYELMKRFSSVMVQRLQSSRAELVQARRENLRLTMRAEETA